MSTKYLWIALGVIAVGVAGFFGLRLLIDRISPRPDNLGVTDGKLAPCPPYPACVNSQSDEVRHRIAPIAYDIPTNEAKAHIVEIVRGMERAAIITETATYVYAEFTTSGFRYTDDVEFFFDESAQVIHVRSSARVPYYDFQVNRNRVEAIRSAFNAQH